MKWQRKHYAFLSTLWQFRPLYSKNRSVVYSVSYYYKLGDEAFVAQVVVTQRLWVRFNKTKQNAALSSVTQRALPREFGGKWGTEYLNTRFPLPILLRAGYSEKLILTKK